MAIALVIGLIGILGSILMGLVGWMQWYLVVGVILTACLLYENQGLFAAGIMGIMSMGIFATLNMFPMNIYWSIIILISLLLSTKVVFNLMRMQT